MGHSNQPSSTLGAAVGWNGSYSGVGRGVGTNCTWLNVEHLRIGCQPDNKRNSMPQKETHRVIANLSFFPAKHAIRTKNIRGEPFVSHWTRTHVATRCSGIWRDSELVNVITSQCFFNNFRCCLISSTYPTQNLRLCSDRVVKDNWCAVPFREQRALFRSQYRT